MDTDGEQKASPAAAGGASAVGLLPEIEAYAYLLTVMYLVDQKAYEEVCFQPSLWWCTMRRRHMQVAGRTLLDNHESARVGIWKHVCRRMLL